VRDYGKESNMSMGEYLFFLEWAQANAMPIQISLINEMNE
jgi:hypothetical protein